RDGVQQVDRGLSKHQAIPRRSLERLEAQSSKSGQPRTVDRREESAKGQGRRRLVEDVGDDFAVKFSLAQDRVAYDSLDLVDVDAPALRRDFGFSRRALL